MKRLVITALLLMFVFPAWGQDEMPAYVLFRLITANDGNPDDQLQFQAGWPIAVRAQNQYGGKQVLPKFGQLVITDATVQQIQDSYIVSWPRAIDWEVVTQDTGVDLYTLNVFVKPEYVSASGLNALTRTQVENYLNRWNATVDGFTQNSVEFSSYISDAIQSEGFWEVDLTGVVFDEKAYDSVTGIHRTEIDFTATGYTQTQVVSKVVNRCGLDSVVNSTSKKVTFDCIRQIVFQEFKEDVKQKLDGQFSLCKWRLYPAAIQAIVDAGGSLEVTKAQAVQGLRHRLDD